MIALRVARVGMRNGSVDVRLHAGHPLVMHLFQKCDDDVECASALQAMANVTSPSSVAGPLVANEFYRDGGLQILKERISNFASVPNICENAMRCVANLAIGGAANSVEMVDKM